MKFISVYKFILSDINITNIDSYVIKNAHIDCEKDTYDGLNDPIIKPLNDEMKSLMKEYIYFYMWNEDKNGSWNIPKERILMFQIL